MRIRSSPRKACAIRPVIIVSPPPTVHAPTIRNRKMSSTAIAASATTGSRVLRKNSIVAPWRAALRASARFLVCCRF